jgi:Na+-translocating ferredoxin:NAD+ oxidoreductase RNF subunit RnfB
MSGVILATIIVGVCGLVLGLFLCFFSEKFAVPVDEREVAVRGELPGNNCGGCGYAGCDGLAAAIAKGEAEVNACPVGGDAVAQAIGAIMGVDAAAGVREVAYVKCSGNCEVAKEAYEYSGPKDCVFAASAPGGGSKACSYGCLGLGSCVSACPFDAICVVDGIAKVDADACKACGKCVAICPKGLIELIPETAKWMVNCSSKDKGKDVMQVCSVGCIGCGLCVKECHFDAITVTDNVAHIDQDKCKGCGLCAKKCPKKIIGKRED